MTIKELRELVDAWKQWAITADRSEDGWQADFPEWAALVEAAGDAMSRGITDQSALDLLAECWQASEEGEELVEYTKNRISECWPVLEALAESKLPACRWQVYEAAGAAGSKAEHLLRKGLKDADAYARRRAIFALARLRPHDAPMLAESLMRDPEPYIRQAAIEMVLATEDEAFKTRALRVLASDAVEHVRRAAHSHIG
jgi:HEAT repeat protein